MTKTLGNKHRFSNSRLLWPTVAYSSLLWPTLAVARRDLDRYDTDAQCFLFSEFWYDYDVSFEFECCIFSKLISKQVEAGPIKEKSTISNFLFFFLEFSSFFMDFPPYFFFWNFIHIFGMHNTFIWVGADKTGLL